MNAYSRSSFRFIGMGAALGVFLLSAGFVAAQTTPSSAPRLTSVTMTSKVFSEYTGSVFFGDQVTLTFTGSVALQKPTVTINGKSATVTGAKDNKTWTAKAFMGKSEPEGPVSFVINAKTTAGVALAPVSSVTSGSKPSFVGTPSPTYCLYNRHFTASNSPLTYTGSYTRSYILDPLCAPTANIAIFSATVGSSSAYTVKANTNNTIKIEKDCGFLGFSCDKELKVKYGTTQSTSGSLPAYVMPNEKVTLSWQCQPFQVMLWQDGDSSWWGLSDDDYIKGSLFAYSTTPTGVGFSTNGKLKGSVTVSPTATTAYKINCGSTRYQFPEIKILVDNPQGSITASPLTIRPGGKAQVYWSATNVKENTCTVTDNAGRAVVIPPTTTGKGRNAVTVPPADTNMSPTAGVTSEAVSASMSPATFTLTCERYSGEKVSWVSNPVTVATTCQPTFNSRNLEECSFNTTASTLEGGKVDMRWYCPATNQSYRIESSVDKGKNWSNVTSGSVPNGNNRERTHTLSNGQGPIDNTTYRLTCVSTNGNSVGSDETTIAHPNLSLTHGELISNVLGGVTTRLTWSAQNVNSNSCRVTGGPSSATLGSGNTNTRGLGVTIPTLPANYTLTCQTPASAANRTPAPTRNLTVYAPGTEPTLTIDLSPLQVREQEYTDLTWTGTNLPAVCTITTSPAIPTVNSSVNSTPTGDSGAVRIGPVLAPTNVTLTCGPASETKTVGLIPEYQEI